MAVRALPTTQRRPLLTGGRREALGGYLLVLPVCLVLLGLVAYPFVYAIVISFTSRAVGYAGEFVGLRNYRFLFGWVTFSRAVWNTVTLVLVSDILKLVIGLGLALLLNERIRGRNLFRSFILLPWAMPAFVGFLTWRLLFLPIGGGIDLILSHFPFYNGPIDWLGQRAT